MSAGSAILAPSILSANFSQLKEEISEVEAAGVQWLHVDVMDGHFVPNLTIGPVVVKGIRPCTKLFLDCHLMVNSPGQWIEPFSKAGADQITFHAEVAKDPIDLIEKIQQLGCRAGVAINPDTPVSKIESILDRVDLVLVMSVFPGFAGQEFIETSLTSVQQLSLIHI